MTLVPGHVTDRDTSARRVSAEYYVVQLQRIYDGAYIIGQPVIVIAAPWP
jgi:hypothetical protein